ncbi:hypothetical protein DL766_009497 [Monosporascus sp. MC13-8B]|uniref:Uncharacterized protein n=1 Tax=Monosporascus cannonballus TaxID=155416 RepID=A0ABY0H5S6_9PEZI|nr:hypothetical protein DL763_007600 [Monosporascus cannonballus]RYO84761.1 hypothetical protein DL762_005483 [Monosporascus cannonballus]RYP15083.1 hypothetical protein DL766_009497 [Monosporascus sp. MC13-8B]
MQPHIVTALLGLAAVKGAAADFEIYIRGTNEYNSPKMNFKSVGAQIHDHSPMTCEEMQEAVTLDNWNIVSTKYNDASKCGWACDGCSMWPRVQEWPITRFDTHSGRGTVDGVRGNPHPLFDHATGAMRDKYHEVLGHCWRPEHPQELACPFIDIHPTPDPPLLFIQLKEKGSDVRYGCPLLNISKNCLGKTDFRPHHDLDGYGPGGGYQGS